MKIQTRHIAALAVLWTTSGGIHATTASKTLEAKCAAKIKQMDWTAGFQGEKLDDFCHGYLLGAFEVMASTKAICPNARDLVTPEYLWSVVQTFKDKSKAALPEAQGLVSRAFSSAFGCDKPKK